MFRTHVSSFSENPSCLKKRMSTFRALLTYAGYGKIPCVPWDSALLFGYCLSICTPLLDTRGSCWRALRHTSPHNAVILGGAAGRPPSHSRSVRFCGFRFARRLHSLPAVYELFYFFEEIVSFWHKGRVKLRDNAGSHIHIATPFYLL